MIQSGFHEKTWKHSYLTAFNYFNLWETITILGQLMLKKKEYIMFELD